MTDEWLEHNRELTRKTADVVDRLARAYNAEKVTKREFYLSVRSIYDSTSGLIDHAYGHTLSNILAELTSRK